MCTQNPYQHKPMWISMAFLHLGRYIHRLPSFKGSKISLDFHLESLQTLEFSLQLVAFSIKYGSYATKNCFLIR